MKTLPQPTIADISNLRSLARNARLSSFPFLRDRIRDVLKSYVAYRAANGSMASPSAPVPLQMSPALAESLRSHYNRPPGVIAPFLGELREKGSPDVCPMCGSLGTGTLDHVFPKARFPELAVFSKNLVPACICNSKRRDNAGGAGVGERVLHPYFDSFLNQRLVRAEIRPSASHSYERPAIDLVIVIPPSDPKFPAVQYHVDKVIRPTQALSHCDASWPKLMRRPSDHFNLPDGLVSFPVFESAVAGALQRADSKFGTPNNWESMLLAGILAAPSASAFLHQRFLDLRTGSLAPEDI